MNRQITLNPFNKYTLLVSHLIGFINVNSFSLIFIFVFVSVHVCACVCVCVCLRAYVWLGMRGVRNLISYKLRL